MGARRGQTCAFYGLRASPPNSWDMPARPMERLLVPARTILARRDLTVLLACNVLLGISYSFVAPFMSMFGTIELKMPPVTFGAQTIPGSQRG